MGKGLVESLLELEASLCGTDTGISESEKYSTAPWHDSFKPFQYQILVERWPQIAPYAGFKVMYVEVKTLERPRPMNAHIVSV